MPTLTLTPEQEAIREAAAAGLPGKVVAYAGTGKTTTLRLIAEARPRDRILYLAFNKVIADEAKAKMPPHVTSRTTHSLAFDGTRTWRGYRPVVGSWWRLKQDILRAEGDTIDRSRMYGRSAEAAFAAVAGTLARFCNSADPEPNGHHVPRAVLDPYLAAAYHLEGAPTTEAAQKRLEDGIRRVIGQAAARIWAVARDRGDWPVTHDMYLKVWQLSTPTIPADLILFDEAQDAAPVQQALVLAQRGRLWMVGDPHQAIYEWRGAIDALSHYDAPAYPLSRSWRFGAAIAAVAGRILDLWGVDPPLTGGGPPGQVVLPGPDLAPETVTEAGCQVPAGAQTAILCRTNIGVMQAALDALDTGRAVAVAGGADGLADLIDSAVALYHGGSPRHPDLRDFVSWDELRLLSEVPGGEAWAPIVRLVEQGADHAARMAARLRHDTVAEAVAGVVVSTAHKAKGRQWPIVRFGHDWRPFQGRDPNGRPYRHDEEARLWYVAMTRPTHCLDLTAAGAAWTRNWEEGTA